MRPFRPMKPPAGSINLDIVKFPCYVSPKIDGIRAAVHKDILYSSTMKPIPNHHIQNLLGNAKHNGLDGELVVGDPRQPDSFKKTTSIVMSHDKVEDFTYWVFDYLFPGDYTFESRLISLARDMPNFIKNVITVPQHVVYSLEQLEELESEFVKDGWEGIMMRSPKGVYKHGRSTPKSQEVLRFKRFEQSEAKIIGFVEGMDNTANEKVKNEFGIGQRATLKENKVPNGTMGALMVKDIESGVEFEIGTGFNAAERADIWKNQNIWIGRTITYSHFAIGGYDKPRFPSYKGVRGMEDMTDY